MTAVLGALAPLAVPQGDQLMAYALLMLASVLVGWLLPRPKWVQRGLNARALFLSTPFGRQVRALSLAIHGALIVRAVWREFFAVGTFRSVARALWLSLSTGQAFVWPSSAAIVAEATAAAATAAASAKLEAEEEQEEAWYLTDDDLQSFKWVIEQDGRPAGASGWEHMMDKDWPGATYTAWRRSVAGGKSEYKSVTVAEDATAEEFMDFYLDDDTRAKWDSMISEHSLLQTGNPAQRQQVVRWVRTFPFAFLSQREYVIARRMWRAADGSLYAVTKGITHPAAPADGRMVRMESFHSCWRSRTVPCPRGSDRPACETVLLHFEDFKINERLARFAVRHGMAGFVKSMVPEVQRFVSERRSRCAPFAEDSGCYGARSPLRALPSASLRRSGSDASASEAPSSSSCAVDASLRLTDSAYASSEQGSEGAGAGALDRSPSMQRSASLRRLGVVMAVSGMAYALARSSSTGSVGAMAGSGSRSSSGRGHAQHRQGKQHRHPYRHRRQQRPAVVPALAAPTAAED